jgi:hypothetical protein
MDGTRKYLTFSNQRWQKNAQLEPLEFDVAVSAEKNNPYNRVAQNQTLTELWKLGVFRPEYAASAKLLLENMYLDGKEKLIEQLELQENLAVGNQAVGGV